VQEHVLEGAAPHEDAFRDEAALVQAVRGGVAVVRVQQDAVGRLPSSKRSSTTSRVE
jgi:hypothetical protein